jgi:hypothetical protein
VYGLGRRPSALKQRTRYGDAPQYDDASCNVPHRNIVCWGEGRLRVESKWPSYRMVLNGNVYWDCGSARVTFPGFSLGKWRKKGMWLDEESVVGDAQFADGEQNDSRPKATSPARELGAAPFDVTAVGPRAQG